MHSPSAALPAWLPGVWTREWIERKGARTDLLEVHYFQSPSAFGDVRFPRDRPSFAHARSFAELSDAELMLLAKQRGFAGFTTMTADVATWHREIDFQPPDTSVDAGRLKRIDHLHMREHALDGSYTESWRSVGATDGGFLVLREEHAERVQRVLIVAGDRFLYVRNRKHDLPVAESLESLASSTHASRAEIVEYLDCEFSYGQVRGGSAPWTIEQSTIPWREGAHLELADELVAIDGGASVARRIESADTLRVQVNTFAKSGLENLFPSSH
ncbi:MAG: hypothetical protein M3Y30_03620 [Gemmatimonadota bacterium]|nr:hypothetical protein [Gemmatimonadota bacterium]